MRRRREMRNRKSVSEYGKLEARNLLANDVLPDVFAWASEDRGYLYDYRVEGDLLRFSTAFANIGAGHLEVFGGDPTASGNQEVFQRIYDDEGGFRDRLAGEFTYHEGHGHIHFDGYAIYNLREIGPGGEVGDILATGGKISFCLIDITRYDDAAGSSNYGSCGTTQGVSAGWSDVYGSGLSNQWINISGIADGDYYLEVVTDPEDKLLESDETNNTTIITVTIAGGPGDNGDRLEPNNSFATAFNMSAVSSRYEEGLSIHTDQDTDFYQFAAADSGNFDISVEFSHALGNLDAFVYDSDFNLITSSQTTSDLEQLSLSVLPGQAYFLKIEGVNGATNGYDLQMNGPGNLITSTVMSENVPLNIPDGAGNGQAGETLISTLEGPDVTVSDLNLVFENLQHTWMADLSIALVSPSGTRAHIIRSDYEGAGDGPLGSDDNFIGTILDDQAPTNIGDGNAPYTGSFNVNFGDISNPLGVFNGESALGTWTVEITDWFSADQGTLNEWGLTFTGIDNNPGDFREQNDSFPQATDFGMIGVVNEPGLSIHNPSDVDFYRFNAQDSTHVQIDLSYVHADGNLDLVVYDSNQEIIARAETINDDESLLVEVVEGELYFIEVFGTLGAANDYDLQIDVPRLSASSGTIGSVGESWQWVEFDHEFENPVVIVSNPTANDRVAVTVDIDQVSETGFWVRLNQWHQTSDTHGAEDLNYFVIEEGTHTLRDGTVIAAGRERTLNTSLVDHQFDAAFSTTPIVIGQVENSEDAINYRLESVDETGFRGRTQVSEAFEEKLQVRNWFNWIAIEPGSGSTSAGNFEVGQVEMSARFETVSLAQTYSETPHMFMAMQTFNENDAASVRLVSSNQNQFRAFVQEETSADEESNHGSEMVGYFAIGDTDLFAAESGSSARASFGSGDFADEEVRSGNTRGSQIASFGLFESDKHELAATVAFARPGLETIRMFDSSLAGSIDLIQQRDAFADRFDAKATRSLDKVFGEEAAKGQKDAFRGLVDPVRAN